MKQLKKIIILTEDISEPMDEGIKKYSFKLVQYFLELENAIVYTYKNYSKIKYQNTIPKNKLFLSISFLKKLKKEDSDIILYIPNSSSTLMSFFRLKLISTITRKKSILISVQKRNHFFLSKFMIKYFLKPNLIFVFSKREKLYYNNLKLNTEITIPGVNTKKFFPVTKVKKLQIKKSLGFNDNQKIILHVGHINKNRNIEILKTLASSGYLVIIIGSTCFNDDEKLKQEMELSGITIINSFIENINEYYLISDLYVFPVQNNSSVIEFPLSILEAMACNIPVLTTKFGSLPNHFTESNYFKYFNDENDIVVKTNKLIKEDASKCNNSELIEREYTWEARFNELFDKLNPL